MDIYDQGMQTKKVHHDKNKGLKESESNAWSNEV